MEKQFIYNIMQSLNETDINFYSDNDRARILKLFKKISEFNSETITLEELEAIKKEIDYLEINFDDFSELSYYFNSIYYNTKNKIKSKNINKIREENKKKREGN